MIERLQEFFANSPSESNFCESTEIENKNLNEEEALAQSLETMAVDDEEKILNSMDTQGWFPSGYECFRKYLEP